MNFDLWSYEKRNVFLKSFRYKSMDEIFYAFRKEGLEIHKAQDNDFYAMTPEGRQYYFAVKPLKAKLTETQKKMKEKFKNRYFLIVRE
jgi:hypothetical protein